MDLQLTGKKVFISGSTSGIGFGIASWLLKEGAEVIVNGRVESSVQTAIDKLKEKYPQGQVTGIATDFIQKDQVELLGSAIRDIDILVNNVGIYTSDSFFNISDDTWLEQFEVNVMSGVRLSRSVLPSMLEKDWGRIIFISSECASLVPTDMISYSTTKAALHALSRGLANLTRGTAVTVNTIMPGSTLTQGAKNFLANHAKAENKSMEEVSADFFIHVRTSSLLQRFASVDEIASMVCYLASPLSAATNGATIKLEGGSTGGIL
jgi:NAD(P)-dependent dehydrogenase (short-subunit alcohol dehydrogenase family)